MVLMPPKIPGTGTSHSALDIIVLIFSCPAQAIGSGLRWEEIVEMREKMLKQLIHSTWPTRVMNCLGMLCPGWAVEKIICKWIYHRAELWQLLVCLRAEKRHLRARIRHFEDNFRWLQIIIGLEICARAIVRAESGKIEELGPLEGTFDQYRHDPFPDTLWGERRIISGRLNPDWSWSRPWCWSKPSAEAFHCSCSLYHLYLKILPGFLNAK